MGYTLPPKGMRLPAFPTETRPETDKVPWAEFNLAVLCGEREYGELQTVAFRLTLLGISTDESHESH